MYLLRMALRNLSLHRGRTLLIAGILTLAVVFFLFMESLMMGLMEITFDNVIDFETPHIEIGRERFFTEADAGKILPLEETFFPGTEMLNAAEAAEGFSALRSEEHTSELQSRPHLVCRLLLEKKKK